MNLKCFFDAYQFPVVSTRAANVYGPGQQLYRIIPRAMLFARLGKKMELHGGGVSKRSFIHMEDVSEATWAIMEKGTLGQTYHISTDRIVTIRELVEIIAKKMGVAFEDLAVVGEERLGKDAAYMLDSTKLRTELGWKDKISLEEGLTDTASWIDRFLPELKTQNPDYVHKP
jgi:dTDP-glucose 4,6-dehydratase